MNNTYKPNNVYLNGGVNGSYKQQGNIKKKLTKNEAISALRKCNYRTPPKDLATYLEAIFGLWEEKPQHWLYIAQRYTPKSINSVISQMVKTHDRGAVPLKTPGAYFTKILTRYHKPRKAFRATNGGHKQQE